MGHAYVKNLNDILIKKIYAKGKTSIQECIDHCKKHNEALHASEGDYNDEYMLSYGFEEIILFHAHSWVQNNNRPNIEPIVENEKQKIVIQRFMKNGLSWLGDEKVDLDEFKKINWRFTKGTRALYLKKEMPIILNIEN